MNNIEWEGSSHLSEYQRNPETKWILAAQAGYTLAFEELMTRYESRVYRLALRIMQNQNEAEDLRRDTFIKAQEHLGEFRVDSCFSLWLTGILTKEALRIFHDRHPNELDLNQFEETGDAPAPNDVADWPVNLEKGFTEGGLNQILSHGINRLNPISRIVFLLCDQEKCSVQNVADILELRLPAIRSCLLRARLKMREYLNRHSSRRNDALSSCIAPPKTKQKEIDHERTVSSTAQ